MPDNGEQDNTQAIPLANVKYVCPHCDGEAIFENNVVHVRLKVTAFDAEGEPMDFVYPWRVIDDTIRTVEENEAERWYCDDCCKEFDTLAVQS
jgi:transposase-like protein